MVLLSAPPWDLTPGNPFLGSPPLPTQQFYLWPSALPGALDSLSHSHGLEETDRDRARGLTLPKILCQDLPLGQRG